jgi:hypothetical protein
MYNSASSVLHDIGKNLDRNKQVDVLYLDFSKAFDSVDYDNLLHKLQIHKRNTFTMVRKLLER